MGDQPLEVTLDEFRIGDCKILDYSASFKTRSGESLMPSSFNFDPISRKLTVQGAKTDLDVIPCDADSIEIVVEVSGSASPSLNTTMQFVVSLRASATQSRDRSGCNPNLDKLAKSKPYFQGLGNDPLVIELAPN